MDECSDVCEIQIQSEAEPKSQNRNVLLLQWLVMELIPEIKGYLKLF